MRTRGWRAITCGFRSRPRKLSAQRAAIRVQGGKDVLSGNAGRDVLTGDVPVNLRRAAVNRVRLAEEKAGGVEDVRAGDPHAG